MGRPKETIDPKIGARIRIIRENMKTKDGKKISRELFAEMLDVSSQAVGLWERGQRKVPERVIRILSEELGLDPEFVQAESTIPNKSALLRKWETEIDIEKLSQEVRLLEYIQYTLGVSLSFLEDEEVLNLQNEINDFIRFKCSRLKAMK